jgi:hypothetical protein
MPFLSSVASTAAISSSEVSIVSERNRLALSLLILVLVLGIAGDILMGGIPLGLNVGAWMGLLVAGLALVSRWHRVRLAGGGRWLLLPAIVFALAFAWRDSPVLGLANAVALLTCLTLATSHSRAGQISLAGIGEYVLSGIRLAWGFLAGLFILWAGDLRWAEFPRGPWTSRALAVGRGVAIAVPLLLVFGGLFASADAVFSRAVADLFRWDVAEMVRHLFWIMFWAVIAAGVLRETILASGPWSARIAGRPSMGITEMGIALGALDLLFLAFVLVQLRYLFGGAALVDASIDLTYAEYARRGFFELVAVVALALPLLLAADWLRPRGGGAHDWLFRAFAGALVAMLFVVTASAVQRMMLYQDEFGLTELRLYTTAFMGWLVAVLAWFVATVLRGRRERFAFGAMIAGLAMVALLNVLNPDALIVSTNVERAQAGKRFDAAYVATLSADAVPEILRALPQLPEEDRQTVAQGVAERWAGTPTSDLRSWNWARVGAREIVGASEETWRAAAGPGASVEVNR